MQIKERKKEGNTSNPCEHHEIIRHTRGYEKGHVLEG